MKADVLQNWFRSSRLTLALAAFCLIATGCRTFNYTDEDLARERKQMLEGYANHGSGWGMGWGGGARISPSIGNIQCPGVGVGGICPGK